MIYCFVGCSLLSNNSKNMLPISNDNSSPSKYRSICLIDEDSVFNRFFIYSRTTLNFIISDEYNFKRNLNSWITNLATPTNSEDIPMWKNSMISNVGSS